MCRLFGPKVVSPKLITKDMLVLFDHKDGKVRAAAVNLCQELYRWMKDALKPAIQDLKPAMVRIISSCGQSTDGFALQLKDLDTAFAAVADAKAAPERHTRSAQAKMAAVTEGGGEAAGAAAAEGIQNFCPLGQYPILILSVCPTEEFDPMDAIEAVDVLAKLPKTWFDDIEAATKWVDKKNVLEQLVEAADSPKIADGDFHEVAKVLKKLIGDGNINVAQTAVRACAVLATGLKASFVPYAKVRSHSVNCILLICGI